VLDDLRTWTDVVEKKPGVFYLGRQPFVHFHLLAGDRRRADLKGRTAWTQIDLPQPIDATRRQAFIARLRHAYRMKRGGHGRHTTKVRLS
jgi:hypothetical protein